MSGFRAIFAWLLGHWLLRRFRLASRQTPTSSWRVLSPRDDPSSVRDGSSFFVVSDQPIDMTKAHALVSALERHGGNVSCGAVVTFSDSPRHPILVAAAGYEIGLDSERVVPIPLLAGVPLERRWADATTAVPLAGGPIAAVASHVVESCMAAGWAPGEGLVPLLGRAAELGPAIVVWSVLTRVQREGLLAKTHVSHGGARERRLQGEGTETTLIPPSDSDPGNPAPSPAALWIGEVQHRKAAGHDQSRLRPTVAIRHAATDWGVAELWGDHHFADAVRRSFERSNIGARVVPHHAWSHPFAARDLVITLRGLRQVEAVPGVINVLWVISHPSEVTEEELDDHDLVAVASRLDVDRIRSMTRTPVVTLLQATDWERFHRPIGEPGEGLVFVGNSRGVARQPVLWALGEGLRPWIAGYGWDGLLPPEVQIHPPIPNEDLPDLFNRAGLVLADHWGDMRDLGYISNRLFDVLAAGSLVITDRVGGLEEILSSVPAYSSADELGREARYWLDPANADERRLRIEHGQDLVRRRHTFDQRVGELISTIRTLVENGDALADGLVDA